MEPVDALRSARDFLIATRADYDAARAGFRWPRFDRFNFALDWFDRLDPEREALRIVGGDGAVASRRFGELAEASDRLANFLRGAGVRRGDRVLLMLGNSVPLWEALLALMKLGAVMIPASPLLSASDIDDRLVRAEIGFVIAAAEFTGRIALDGRVGAGRRRAADRLAGVRRCGWRRTAISCPMERPPRTIRCCCISPPAPPPSQSWCGTASAAIRSAGCRRCTGSGCSRAMSISTFPRRAGPSMPGAASSRPGWPRRRCWCSTRSGSIRASRSTR